MCASPSLIASWKASFYVSGVIPRRESSSSACASYDCMNAGWAFEGNLSGISSGVL